MGTVPPPFQFPISMEGPTPTSLIATAAALRLGHHLHRRINHHLLGLRFLLCSSFKRHTYTDHVPGVMDLLHERFFMFKGINFLQLSRGNYSAECSPWLYFFTENENRKDIQDKRNAHLETTRRNSLNGRQLTNVLLAINVLGYIAQIATQGKLMLWGAKINSLIDKGQLWRFATSSFLHANIGHLMVNCYSLNSVGPTMENISGPRRFLAVYFTSAITSSAMSYWFCKAPAVGASGAIFGLVGSFAVFISRHRNLVGGGKQDLLHVANVIVLNMVIGLLSKGIDNWGHLGGLLGGAAVSWLLGPSWSYEATSNDGRPIMLTEHQFSI